MISNVSSSNGSRLFLSSFLQTRLAVPARISTTTTAAATYEANAIMTKITRRQLTTTDLSKHKHMHQAMKGVMGSASEKANTTPPRQKKQPQQRHEPSEADKARRARYQQSIINAVVSFFTVILGAQCLKSGSDKRKLEKQLTQSQKELLDVRRILQQDLPQALPVVAQKCANAVAEEHEANGGTDKNSTGWALWGGANLLPPDDSTDTLETRLLEILSSELQGKLIGTAALDEQEKDKAALADLQKQVFTELQGDELLKELQAIQVDEETTVVKKKVFSI